MRLPGFILLVFVILGSQLKGSKSPRAGRPEGQSESFEVSSWDPYTNMLRVHRLHVSQSRRVQKQGPGKVGGSQFPAATSLVNKTTRVPSTQLY